VPPLVLDHARQYDDVSTIHFDESVSSPTYCYTQAPSRPSQSIASPPPLKFVRSDSLVPPHQESQVSRESATPPIDNTTQPLPALTSLLYLSLVTFEFKNVDSGKHVVRETLQRHVYTSVDEAQPRTRRKSVPVDVDNCSLISENLEDLALSHLERRDIAGAIDVYLESSSLAHEQLAVLYVLHGNRQKAVWSSEQSLLIHRRQDGQEKVNALLNLGIMLLYAQKPQKALCVFQRALHLECKLVGYHHARIPLILNNMAVAHLVLGDADESLVLLQESLELQRHAHKADLLSLQQMATTYLNLGIVSWKRHDGVHATSFFEQGLMVMESVLGVDNAFVQLCSKTLEQLLADRITKSTPRIVKIPVFGNSDGVPMRHGSRPIDAIVMGSLKHELTQQQRIHNAVTTTFRSSMVGIVERRAPKSVPIDLDGDTVMDAELHLAGIHALALKHIRRNEIDEALELLRLTLRSHKSKYGQVHPLVGSALHNIALVNLFAGRYKDAECYFQDAISVRVAALGKDHPDVSTSMLKLGMIQMANDNLDTAYATCTQVLYTRRKVIGYQQPEIAKILNLVAYVQYEYKSILAALESMEEALQIQRNFPECEEDMADTLANMGFLYAKKKEYSEASSVLREALDLQRKVLSDSHPHTLVTRQNLKFVHAFQSEAISFHQTLDPCIESSLEMYDCHPLRSFSPLWNEV
jgi:tetratricopeptide (TPR) repeat protein